MRPVSNYALASFLCMVNGFFILLFTYYIALNDTLIQAGLPVLLAGNILLPIISVYLSFQAFSQIKNSYHAFRGIFLAFGGLSGGIVLLLYQLWHFSELYPPNIF